MFSISRIRLISQKVIRSIFIINDINYNILTSIRVFIFLIIRIAIFNLVPLNFTLTSPGSDNKTRVQQNTMTFSDISVFKFKLYHANQEFISTFCMLSNQIIFLCIGCHEF